MCSEEKFYGWGRSEHQEQEEDKVFGKQTENN